MVFVCKCAFKPSFTHSTSAMFDLGKNTVFKIVIENPGKLSDLAYLDGLDTAAAVISARLLTLTLYDPKRRCPRLWVKLAFRKNASLNTLPPSEASFLQHLKRASWQTNIWLSSHAAQQDIMPL